MKAINIGSVELTVTQTDHSAHIITFIKVYHCPDFFINTILLNVLKGKGIYFNSLHNTINFVKDWAKIAYILYIILVDNPVKVPFTMALATT